MTSEEVEVVRGDIKLYLAEQREHDNGLEELLEQIAVAKTSYGWERAYGGQYPSFCEYGTLELAAVIVDYAREEGRLDNA